MKIIIGHQTDWFVAADWVWEGRNQTGGILQQRINKSTDSFKSMFGRLCDYVFVNLPFIT